VVAGTSAPASPAGALSESEAAVLAKLLAWPPRSLFPALDIARLAALNEAAAAQLAAGMGGLDASSVTGGASLSFLAARARHHHAPVPALGLPCKWLFYMPGRLLVGEQQGCMLGGRQWKFVLFPLCSM
jgi:hypothetical protein